MNDGRRVARLGEHIERLPEPFQLKLRERGIERVLDVREVRINAFDLQGRVLKDRSEKRFQFRESDSLTIRAGLNLQVNSCGTSEPDPGFRQGFGDVEPIDYLPVAFANDFFCAV